MDVRPDGVTRPRLPWLRAEVLAEVTALATGRPRRDLAALAGLLHDEVRVLPDPRPFLGEVFASEREVVAMAALGEVLTGAAAGEPGWAEVVRRAGAVRLLMAEADALAATGWVLTDNVRAFLELVSRDAGYAFDDLDWGAVEAGLPATDPDEDVWFGYPLAGAVRWDVTLAADPGGSVTHYRIDGIEDPLARARVAGYADVLGEHFLAERRHR